MRSATLVSTFLALAVTVTAAPIQTPANRDLLDGESTFVFSHTTYQS